jgi:hypothetical protein
MITRVGLTFLGAPGSFGFGGPLSEKVKNVDKLGKNSISHIDFGFFFLKEGGIFGWVRSVIGMLGPQV